MSLYVEAGYDLADIGQCRLSIVETGGSGISFFATVSGSKHFLRSDGSAAVDATAAGWASKVSDFTPLIAAMQTALNTAGAGSGGAWTVTFDATTERVTIARDGAGGVTSVSIAPAGNGSLLGWTTTKSGALTHEGASKPTYWIKSAIGAWTDDGGGEYEGGDDVAYDIEAHDGSPSGLAKEGAPVYFDFTVPLEPAAIVGAFPEEQTAAVPWTWRDLFGHCRNVLPLVIDADTVLRFVRLRAEGAKFRALELGDNYRAYADIRLLTRVLARA